jgi:2-polyprenyl-6-methoxyphenol hydroxylase-like FAD-dependent oxidoreductase
MTPTVAIAGAGIGGLTLAIALRRRGVPVTVLERASELKPAGAGIALGPNAIVALERLGLRSAIVGAGASIGRSAILDSDGRVLGAELDVAALQREIGAPVVALQRTRLHDVLVDAAGPGVVRLGFTVLEYENLGDRIRVISTDGDRVEADLLVARTG